MCSPVHRDVGAPCHIQGSANMMLIVNQRFYILYKSYIAATQYSNTPPAQTTNPHLRIFLSASASEQLPLTAVIANTSTAPLINFFKTISPTFDFYFDGPPSRLRKWFRFGFQLQANDTFVDFWSAQQPFENLSNDARGLLQQIYKLLMGFLSFKH